MRKSNFMRKFRVFCVVVGLVAVLTAALFVLPGMAEESTTNPLNIAYCNLSFENETHLLFAIESADADVQLLLWNTPQNAEAAYTYGTQDAVVPVAARNYDIDGTPHTVFRYDGLTAKQMTDVVYVRACVVDAEGSATYGDVAKYSILEYARLKLANAATNENLKGMLTAMLDYGATAQTYFAHNATRPANGNWVSVTVSGGTLPDGFSYGLYYPGDTVTLTAPATDSAGRPFGAWQAADGSVASTSPTFACTVGATDERYTAVYYSAGLAFTSNTDSEGNPDGTCTLTGIGTCTDTVINIPPTNSAGETVTTIGTKAFQFCTSLESVTLPNGITQINGYAFQGCSKLTSINLPDSITGIGIFAFDGSGLTDVVLPAEMEVINSGVFVNCTQLKSVVIGKNTDLVTSNAFANCPALESITVVEGNPYYKVIDNCLIYTDSFSERHLVRVWGNFTIPAGIKYIGEYAFDSCKNLARITLPAGVIGINGFAFYNCTGLTSIVIPKSVTFIGSYAFENCTALTTIVYQDTAAKWAAITKDTDWNASTGDYTVYCTDAVLQKDGNTTTTHSANLAYTSTGNGTCMVSDIGTCTDTAIVIPTINPDGERVTEIGQEAFQNATITSVTIHAAITSIPETAFAGCAALESITVAEGNTTYRAEGNCLIRKADNTLVLGCVNSVIPSGITAIGDNAFNGRTGLTRIVIPTSVTSIGNDAFKGCTALDTIVYQGTKTEWAAVTKGTDWNASTDAYTVYCTDGTISKDGTTTTHSAGLRFESYGNGTCKLASIGDCRDTAIVIPPISPAGDLVTEIWMHALSTGSTTITAVTIPDSVTSIGDSAFANCTSLASITIPDGVTTINSYAFSGCTALERVTLPDGLKEIRSWAFQNCTSLTSIALPADLEIIGGYAFEGSGLESISIPDKVWSVTTGAFADCNRLTAIHIGTDQDVFADGAFMGCSAIESITVAEGNLYYEVIDNCLIRIDGSRKSLVIGHKDGVIPNDINIITALAFYGWTELESITIPTGVKTIGYRAFLGCTNLKSIVIPAGVTTIAYSTFEDCTNLTSIVIPASVTAMEWDVFKSCSSLTEIFFQGSTTQWAAVTKGTDWNASTGEYIVYCTDGKVSKDGTTTTAYPTGLEFTSNGDGTCTLSASTCMDEVIFIPPISPAGDLVTAIGDFVFSSHASLTSVTIPDRVTSIGYSAFGSCANLTDITIPDSVESIGDLAFSSCKQLKQISIGAGVTSITPTMFGECSAIETIKVAAGNPKYRSEGNCLIQYKDADENNVSIDVSILVLGCKTSVIPNGITAIGDKAFEYCTGLASITIPDSVTVIGVGAFYGCTNLTSIVLPEGLTTIDGEAFASCTKLASITLPDSVTDIGPIAFQNCSALTSVTLPEGLKNFGDYVFMNCTELTSVTIPASVTSISANAFYSSKLTEIHFQGTTDQWTAMVKATDWDAGTPENLVIYCTDGTVDKAGNVMPLPETGSDTDPDPAA